MERSSGRKHKKEKRNKFKITTENVAFLGNDATKGQREDRGTTITN